MDKELAKKVFIRFLKNNGAFYLFTKCFPSSDDCERYIECTSSLNMLLNAFLWGHTSQGHKYWEKLDEKWVNLLLGLTNTELKEPLAIDSNTIISRAKALRYDIKVEG